MNELLNSREMAKAISDNLINDAIVLLEAKNFLLDEDHLFTKSMMNEAYNILFERIEKCGFTKKLNQTSYYDKKYGEVAAFFVVDEYNSELEFHEDVLLPYIEKMKKDL